MKDDIRKYLPDLATVLRETDPAAVKARREKALEEFKSAQVEAAEAPVAAELPEKPEKKEAAQPAAVASRWASSEASAKIPKEALPSSLAPAAEPVAAPIETAAVGTSTQGKVPRWVRYPALGLLAVVTPILIALLFEKYWVEWKTGKPAASAVPSAASSVEERPAASAASAGSATAAASATAAPSGAAPAPELSTSAAATANPRRPPAPKKKLTNTADASTGSDQDPGLNE